MQSIQFPESFPLSASLETVEFNFSALSTISTRQRRRSRMDWIPLIRQNWSEKMYSQCYVMNVVDPNSGGRFFHSHVPISNRHSQSPKINWKKNCRREEEKYTKLEKMQEAAFVSGVVSRLVWGSRYVVERVEWRLGWYFIRLFVLFSGDSRLIAEWYKKNFLKIYQFWKIQMFTKRLGLIKSVFCGVGRKTQERCKNSVTQRKKTRTTVERQKMISLPAKIWIDCIH